MADPPITYRGVVYPWQCDQMGHMNVAWYVAKFDEATWTLFANMGMTAEWLQATNRGMAALEQKITYRRELRPGDVVTVRTRVVEVREKVILFVHEMARTDTGEVAATTELTAVHLDLATRKSAVLPPDVAAAARAMVETGDSHLISPVVPLASQDGSSGK